MAAIDVGGDTSVMWHVEVGNLRSLVAEPPKPETPKAHKHVGIDETADGKNFTVTVRLPALVDLKKFVDSLRTDQKGGALYVIFDLPIEKGNGHSSRKPDQISIAWESDTSARVSGDHSLTKPAEDPAQHGASGPALQ